MSRFTDLMESLTIRQAEAKLLEAEYRADSVKHDARCSKALADQAEIDLEVKRLNLTLCRHQVSKAVPPSPSGKGTLS